ncbi:MAG: cytochrome c-type biogenesis protein CcmH [Ramlibacter sp.]|nr:cytochrome c-type biogenesis protein CcmH [Ramlibacter sp.]
MPVVRAVAALLMLALALVAAGARQALPLAEDPALEARMAHLAGQLRCLVCQNQTIADSNAPLAVDLKNRIREQLRAGRSDAEVIAYMADRYGDFVLYRPPLKASTTLLWYGPLAFLVLGGAAAWVAVRRRRPGANAVDLSDAQRQRAAALLAGEPEQSA